MFLVQASPRNPRGDGTPGWRAAVSDYTRPRWKKRWGSNLLNSITQTGGILINKSWSSFNSMEHEVGTMGERAEVRVHPPFAPPGGASEDLI